MTRRFFLDNSDVVWEPLGDTFLGYPIQKELAFTSPPSGASEDIITQKPELSSEMFGEEEFEDVPEPDFEEGYDLD